MNQNTNNLGLEELKEENKKLAKICAVKTDMVSISAHQIRTSLSAFKWIMKMFLDGDLGALSPEQETLIRKAYDSNERAIDIVNELLLTNKTENIIEKAYNFEEVSLSELVDNAVFDFSGETHNKGIEVIVLKPTIRPPKIQADREKMRIVIQNLMDNAIKYSDNNGKIFVTLKEEKEDVQVSVKNMGVIISDESKGKIFEKFYRAPEAQQKAIAGTGIGLYIIKEIIEKHGGKVWFESSKEEGTTFFFNIPIKRKVAVN